MSEKSVVTCQCCVDVGSVVKEALESFGNDRPMLEVLKKVQLKTGYLSEEAITEVAKQTGEPVSKIYGVASFYTLFNVKPKGEYIIRLCESAPCYIKGAEDILDALKEELGIDVDQTTEDNKFTLEFSSCLGVCGVAPAMMINDIVYGNLTKEKVSAIIEEYRNQ